MKLLKTSAVLSFLILCTALSAQNLIGYSAKDIRTYMKEKYKNMNYQSMIYNTTFKYLKYTDRNDTQTLLFFLTADSVCKSVRLVCDMNLKAEKIREIDSMYKKSGENMWTDSKNGKKYIVELKDEEWSFSITIRPNE